MEKERTLRRLTALEQSAATARVLNLRQTHRKFGSDPSRALAPFFKNRLLDRAIIVKHRLRPHEYDYFTTPSPIVTKVLLPIDDTDLKSGARSFFIGQKDYHTVVTTAFGDDMAPSARDRQILDLIDNLPSLDPFILREHLRANGFEPARCYFNVSDADLRRMFDFARDELMALANMSLPATAAANGYAARLVEKLLSNDSDTSFGPLKDTLRLSDQEYLDGVFSWRGFIYYKWVLRDLTKPMAEVMAEIGQIRARGPADPEAFTYIPLARTRIQHGLAKAAEKARTLIDVYDGAYAALTREGKPMAFREFLLSAPEMFASLGEQLGALQHIVSFWRYRFPQGRPRLITPHELMDVLLDFEDGLVLA